MRNETMSEVAAPDMNGRARTPAAPGTDGRVYGAPGVRALPPDDGRARTPATPNQKIEEAL